MCFKPGQGILGRITFVDGTVPAKDRTYLIVEVATDFIEVLNISSIKGKERKLAYSTNKRLLQYNPPFLKPSFAKLDSLTRVPKSEWSSLQILHKGATLDAIELERIKKFIIR